MKANTGFIVAFITVASDEEAAAISKSLVESRLAACVSRVDDLRSLYWWRGAVESAHESLLIAKTRAALLPRVIQAVKASHSYTVPEVIALPIMGGNPDYLNWLEEETNPSAP